MQFKTWSFFKLLVLLALSGILSQDTVNATGSIKVGARYKTILDRDPK